MPRAGEISTEKLYEVVKDFDIFEPDVTQYRIVKHEHDPIWKEIAKTLNAKQQPRSLRMTISQNRNQILRRLMEYQGVPEKNPEAWRRMKAKKPYREPRVGRSNSFSEFDNLDNDNRPKKKAYSKEEFIYNFDTDDDQDDPLNFNPEDVCYGGSAPRQYLNSKMKVPEKMWKQVAVREKLPTDAVKRLIELESRAEFHSTIRFIFIIPFAVGYWSPTQINTYKTLSDVIKITLSIDSCTNLVKRFGLNEYDLVPAIYGYGAVCQLGEQIIPLCHMISVNAEPPTLNFWLSSWFRAVDNKSPSEIITNMSYTLQDSICMSFYGCGYKGYLESCYKLLLNEEPSMVPNFWLRIDNTHLLQYVKNWEPFKDKREIQRFYMKSIDFISQLDTIADIYEALQCVFLVAQSPYKYDKCVVAVDWLVKKFETIIPKDSAPASPKPPDSSVFEGCPMIDSFIIEIKDSINEFIVNNPQESENSVQSNLYYAPDVVNYVVKLCNQFPIWTNVMKDKLGSSFTDTTHGTAETYFSILKNSVLEYNEPQDLDLFLVNHIRFNQLVEKVAASDYETVDGNSY